MNRLLAYRLPRRPAKGFTLVELLVVIAILALLAVFAGDKVINIFFSSQTKTAKIQAVALQQKLDIFRLDVGRYPTTAEGLAALATRPANAPGWNGPYVSNEMLIDPWNNPFQYANPGPNGGLQIFSLGADNARGGDGNNADIVVDIK